MNPDFQFACCDYVLALGMYLHIKENVRNSAFEELEFLKLFHDGGSYRMETSPLICPANQWTGFYTIETSVMKVLICPNIVVLPH